MTPEYREARIEHSLRYLKEVRDLAVRHRVKEMYVKSLEEDASSVGGIDYRHVVAGQMPNIDKVPNSVANLIEMKREAEEMMEEYSELKREAVRLLDEMDGTYGRLLSLYYVTALPWIAVAEALNYSEDWVKHMRNDALCEFYDYLPHVYRMPEQPAI